MVRRNQVFILTMVLFNDTFNNIYYLIFFFYLLFLLLLLLVTHNLLLLEHQFPDESEYESSVMSTRGHGSSFFFFLSLKR